MVSKRIVGPPDAVMQHTEETHGMGESSLQIDSSGPNLECSKVQPPLASTLQIQKEIFGSTLRHFVRSERASAARLYSSAVANRLHPASRVILMAHVPSTR